MLTRAVLAISGFVLSLGPSTGVYRWLYEWAMPLRGLRAASRFGYLGSSPSRWPPHAAGCGSSGASTRRAVATAARVRLAAITIEAWQGPVRTEPFTGIPRIYSLLAESASPVRLAEFPFYLPSEVFRNGEYVVNSTAHWQPLENGYSGFTPSSYRERADALWLFPAPLAFSRLQQDQTTHVMVHLEHFGAERQELERDLAGRADLQLMATDRDGHRLYRLIRP